MLQLYAMEITKENENLFEKVHVCFNQERKEKLLRYQNVHTALCSACGELIARVLIGEMIGVAPFSMKKVCNQWGKPSFENIPYQFNVSHSGNWVFCCISSDDVGVDIEAIKDVKEKIAKRCFAKDEYDNLLKKTDELQQQYFYTLWTLKEGYAKYVGAGLQIPLNTVEFMDNEGKMILKENPEQLVVTTGIWKTSYAYSVIGKEPLQEDGIIELKVTEFIKEYC